MDEQTKGIINGIVAAVSYGTNPLFALPLYSGGIGVNSVLFYRYAIAVIIYGCWLGFVKKISLRLSKAEILPLMLLGILFSISSLTMFSAFKYIEVGIVCTILFVYPVIVALIMAIFFKERISKTVIVSICLSLSGISLLYRNGSGVTLNLYGVFLVLISALAYAIYMVGVKQIPSIKTVNQEKLTFCVMLFGLFIYFYNLDFCKNLQIVNTPFLWLCTLGLALLPTIVSIKTINVAINLVGSTTTAILGALEPLTALLVGVLFFHEHLSIRIFSGIFLILFGVILVISRNRIHEFAYQIQRKK